MKYAHIRRLSLHATSVMRR